MQWKLKELVRYFTRVGGAFVSAYGTALIRFLAARITDFLSLFTWEVAETILNTLMKSCHV